MDWAVEKEDFSWLPDEEFREELPELPEQPAAETARRAAIQSTATLLNALPGALNPPGNILLVADVPP